MALADLACLASGIVNVMIPATATETDVAFILRHAGVTAVMVSTKEQLHKVVAAREQVPELATIIAFERDAAATKGVVSFDEVLARAGETPADVLETRRESVTVDDLTTIMYTSGTTGTPKGICFTQRNIVFKRFARALALPEIGEEDRFLCYLPLFHTFGRFFELTGCVFWGATYCFAENPAIDTLVRQMRDLRPTVFISIPMKWIQLYEMVRNEVDVESASDEQLTRSRAQADRGRAPLGSVGGRLPRPGDLPFLPAPRRRAHERLRHDRGHRRHHHDAARPVQGRLPGLPLPGVEIDLADDGELLIRGPYVMMGYLDPPDGEASFDADGWLHTGDLMETRQRRSHSDRRPQEGDLQERPGPDRCAAEDREPIPRLRIGRPHLSGRRSPALQHRADLPQPGFSGDGPLRPSRPRTARTTSGRWWSARTPFSRRSNASWTSPSSTATSRPTAASSPPRAPTAGRPSNGTSPTLSARSIAGRRSMWAAPRIMVPNWLFQALGITVRRAPSGPGPNFCCLR